jgi:hypothetical protein
MAKSSKLNDSLVGDLDTTSFIFALAMLGDMASPKIELTVERLIGISNSSPPVLAITKWR